MANSLLTPSVITKETLVMLENNLVAANKVNRSFQNQFVKIGTTLTVRKPNRFKAVNSTALQIQDINEPFTSITVNTQTQVAWEFSSQDLELTIDDFSERYCKPGASEMANAIDYGVLGNFASVYNMVGTPGAVPAAFSSITAVGQRMDEEAAPQEGRTLILGTAAYWSLVNALVGNYVTQVAAPAFKGFLANLANFEIYLDQNTQSQTVGAYSGTPVVNGAGQTGNQLITSGWGNSITGLLNVGDVFTIAGVYAVNPKNRQSTGQLRNFVVTAIANSGAGGASTISINPAIIPTGAYQTVTASPANSAAISVKGSASTSYGQNIGFVRDAFGLVTVPLPLPRGADFAARETWKNISLRIWRDGDITNDQFPTRLDILWGTSTFYPELACRLTD